MHAAALFLVLQSAFSPQGDGVHGSIDSVILGGTKQRIFFIFSTNKNSDQFKFFLIHLTYMLLFFDRRQKHPQCILDHICIKANDLSQNKKQILHKLQDKDLYTSGQCMQGLLGIQY